MKYIVGLTGPSGAGKGEVSRVFEKNGYTCIDCDKISAQSTQSDSPILPQLKKAFGNVIVEQSGRLDRGRLAQIVFSSQTELDKLNRIMLPYLTEIILNQINSIDNDKVLLDAPTLIESGLNKKCNCVISVLADKRERVRRIILRDKIDYESAEKRVDAQHDDEFYIAQSDYTVKNDGDVAELVKQVQNLIYNEILCKQKEVNNYE